MTDELMELPREVLCGCLTSFYRCRNVKQPRFKSGKRKNELVPVRAEMRAIVRHLIRQIRRLDARQVAS